MVQEVGLDMLIYVDGLRTQERDQDEFRKALVASGEWDAKALYPDRFAAPPQEEESEEGGATVGSDPDVVYDYSGVTWESPGENNFEAEMLALQAAMGDNSSVSVEDGDGAEQDQPVLEPVDDREWV